MSTSNRFSKLGRNSLRVRVLAEETRQLLPEVAISAMPLDSLLFSTTIIAHMV